MPKYEISIANQECLEELSRFVVEENYKHHSTNSPSKEKLESDIMTVYNEEKALYSDTSNIYIARYDHKIIGSIRVFISSPILVGSFPIYKLGKQYKALDLFSDIISSR